MASSIRIALTSVLVEDQDHAERFYTEVLGFEVKRNIPVGDDRFLTVVSPAGAHGVELLLEPNHHPAAKEFQSALLKDGIPIASFFTDDLAAEYVRMGGMGVTFTVPPTDAGEIKVAVFEDTCGNLVQLVQE